MKGAVLSLGLLFAIVFALLNNPTFAQSDDKTTEDFKRELENLPDDILHRILRQLPNFKEGIFEHRRNAIEVICSSNPSMATHLVHAARYDLLRRQNNFTTSSTTSTKSIATVIVPVTVVTTNTVGSKTTTTVAAISSATASLTVPTVSTDSQGRTVTITATVPAVVVTKSDGSVITTPAATLNANRPATLTQVDDRGSTLVTVITPSGSVFSSVVLETKTYSDGTKSTLTSLSVVPAATQNQEGTLVGAAPSAGGRPTLSRILITILVLFAILF